MTDGAVTAAKAGVRLLMVSAAMSASLVSQAPATRTLYVPASVAVAAGMV
jgi:hypothetical protein